MNVEIVQKKEENSGEQLRDVDHIGWCDGAIMLEKKIQELEERCEEMELNAVIGVLIIEIFEEIFQTAKENGLDLNGPYATKSRFFRKLYQKDRCYNDSYNKLILTALQVLGVSEDDFNHFVNFMRIRRGSYEHLLLKSNTSSLFEILDSAKIVKFYDTIQLLHKYDFLLLVKTLPKRRKFDQL